MEGTKRWATRHEWRTDSIDFQILMLYRYRQYVSTKSGQLLILSNNTSITAVLSHVAFLTVEDWASVSAVCTRGSCARDWSLLLSVSHHLHHITRTPAPHNTHTTYISYITLHMHLPTTTTQKPVPAVSQRISWAGAWQTVCCSISRIPKLPLPSKS